METQLARIVNTGLAGEPQHIALQVIDTLKIFQFSQFKYVNEGGETREVSLIDNNLDQPEIQIILYNGTQTVEIAFDENDNVTLHF
jgi:hypothetical protein